jgi:lipopolysaccharide assembly outer membrane protein LptD (OstA)
LVVAKVRNILSVSKLESHNFDMKRLNSKSLKGMETREQYQIKFRDRFAAMNNLDVSVDLNRVSENIK